MEVGEKGRSKAIPPTLQLSPPTRICFTSHLSVCLQFHIKTTDRIMMRFLPEMYPWTRKSPLYFGSQFRSGSGSRSFWRKFYHSGTGGISAYFAEYSNSCRQSLTQFFEGCMGYVSLATNLPFGADPEHDPDPEIFNVILPLRAVVKVVTWSQVGANPIPIPHQLIWRYLGIKEQLMDSIRGAHTIAGGSNRSRGLSL